MQSIESRLSASVLAVVLCTTIAGCSEGEADPSDEIGAFQHAGQSGDWAFTAQGRLESSAGLRQLGARVAGILEVLLVVEGENVSLGQVVARVDCRDREAFVAVTDAQVAKAASELALLRAGTRTEDIRAGEAELARALALVADARSAHEKALPLHASGVASTRSLESLAAVLDAAKAEAGRARARLDALRLGPRAEEIAAAEAAYRMGVSTHQQALVAVEQCNVVSPVGGEVARVHRRSGEAVGGLASDSVLDVVDLSALEVRAQIDERYVGRVGVGQPVEFWLEGEAQRFSGQVIRTSAAMGRKSDFANASNDKADRDVREVIIVPAAGGALPEVHGLRVIIGFRN